MFQRGDLAQPSQVSVGLSEFGGEKSLDQIPRQFRAFDAPTQTDDVEVVVLDALLRRKMILNQASADAVDLVRANRSADAAAANRQTTMHRFSGYCLAKRNDEVGIIIIGRQLMSTEVHDLVTGGFQSDDQLLFQGKAAVVCCYAYTHEVPFASIALVLPAAARSANTTAVSFRMRPAGMDASPSARRWRISAFPGPFTNHRMLRARLRTG